MTKSDKLMYKLQLDTVVFEMWWSDWKKKNPQYFKNDDYRALRRGRASYTISKMKFFDYGQLPKNTVAYID